MVGGGMVGGGGGGREAVLLLVQAFALSLTQFSPFSRCAEYKAIQEGQSRLLGCQIVVVVLGGTHRCGKAH